MLPETAGSGTLATLAVTGEPFLELLGIVAGGWQMGRAALAADRLLRPDPGSEFLTHKILGSRFYADHVLPRSAGLRHAVVAGAGATLAYAESAF